MIRKKERPGDFTRPNLHKTPTRLRLLGHNRGGILCENLANYQQFRSDGDEKKSQPRRNSLLPIEDGISPFRPQLSRLRTISPL
jgi:hypothetical protein